MKAFAGHLLCLALAGLCACSVGAATTGQAPTLDPVWRTYGQNVRAHLSSLTPEQRAAVEPFLEAHERTVADFDAMAGRGATRRAVQRPLLLLGAVLMADDSSGFGLIDDLALPFVGAALAATMMTTAAPATSTEQTHALDAVTASGQVLADIMQHLASGVVASIAAPGTRQHCIDKYVDCQLNARRNFSRRGCQPCMDQCLGQGYQWPPTCDYK